MKTGGPWGTMPGDHIVPAQAIDTDWKSWNGDPGDHINAKRLLGDAEGAAGGQGGNTPHTSGHYIGNMVPMVPRLALKWAWKGKVFQIARYLTFNRPWNGSLPKVSHRGERRAHSFARHKIVEAEILNGVQPKMESANG